MLDVVKYSSIRDNRRTAKQIMRTHDGWSVFIKETQVSPIKLTLYAFHIFINNNLTITHRHFKYRAPGFVEERRWFKYESGQRITIEELIELISPP